MKNLKINNFIFVIIWTRYNFMRCGKDPILIFSDHFIVSQVVDFLYDENRKIEESKGVNPKKQKRNFSRENEMNIREQLEENKENYKIKDLNKDMKKKKSKNKKECKNKTKEQGSNLYKDTPKDDIGTKKSSKKEKYSQKVQEDEVDGIQRKNEILEVIESYKRKMMDVYIQRNSNETIKSIINKDIIDLKASKKSNKKKNQKIKSFINKMVQYDPETDMVVINRGKCDTIYLNVDDFYEYVLKTFNEDKANNNNLKKFIDEKMPLSVPIFHLWSYKQNNEIINEIDNRSECEKQNENKNSQLLKERDIISRKKDKKSTFEEPMNNSEISFQTVAEVVKGKTRNTFDITGIPLKIRHVPFEYNEKDYVELNKVLAKIEDDSEQEDGNVENGKIEKELVDEAIIFEEIKIPDSKIQDCDEKSNINTAQTQENIGWAEIMENEKIVKDVNIEDQIIKECMKKDFENINSIGLPEKLKVKKYKKIKYKQRGGKNKNKYKTMNNEGSDLKIGHVLEDSSFDMVLNKKEDKNMVSTDNSYDSSEIQGNISENTDKEILDLGYLDIKTNDLETSKNETPEYIEKNKRNSEIKKFDLNENEIRKNQDSDQLSFERKEQEIIVEETNRDYSESVTLKIEDNISKNDVKNDRIKTSIYRRKKGYENNFNRFDNRIKIERRNHDFTESSKNPNGILYNKSEEKIALDNNSLITPKDLYQKKPNFGIEDINSENITTKNDGNVVIEQKIILNQPPVPFNHTCELKNEQIYPKNPFISAPNPQQAFQQFDYKPMEEVKNSFNFVQPIYPQATFKITHIDHDQNIQKYYNTLNNQILWFYGIPPQEISNHVGIYLEKKCSHCENIDMIKIDGASCSTTGSILIGIVDVPQNNQHGYN